jgi:Holliday junction resolvase RusA-like endonuclease
MIAIGIAGPTTKYLRRDVDNKSKVILDAGYNIIYNDDRLINIRQ